MITKKTVLAIVPALLLPALAVTASADITNPSVVSVEVVLLPEVAGSGFQATPHLTCNDVTLSVSTTGSFQFGSQIYASAKLVQTATPGVCIVNRLPVPSNASKVDGQPAKPAYIYMTIANSACPYGVVPKLLTDATLGPTLMAEGHGGNMGSFVVQSWSCAAPPPPTK
jgi:hypothetical protein